MTLRKGMVMTDEAFFFFWWSSRNVLSDKEAYGEKQEWMEKARHMDFQQKKSIFGGSNKFSTPEAGVFLCLVFSRSSREAHGSGVEEL